MARRATAAVPASAATGTMSGSESQPRTIMRAMLIPCFEGDRTSTNNMGVIPDGANTRASHS